MAKTKELKRREAEEREALRKKRNITAKAILTLSQMFNGEMITGNLMVQNGGEIVEAVPTTHIPVYRTRSIKVNHPYNQRVFDSLRGAPQGGVNFFDRSNRKESW